MRQIERVIAYSLVVAGLTVAGIGFVATGRSASAGPKPAPEAAKIATCDVYMLVERLVDSDQYAPARTVEQERIQKQLAPVETELDTLQKELQAANPQDPSAQAKFQTFQQKREAYNQQRQTLFDGYSELVAGQFAQAYEKVTAEVKKVADERGFTYVIAQKTGEIKAREPRQLVEEFLSRPVTLAPADSDITEPVRIAMKLPERGAPAANPIVPDAQPAGGGEMPKP